MIRQHSREQVMVEACMKRMIEWPFRGQSEIRIWRVGTDGNRTRYQSGVYVCT